MRPFRLFPNNDYTYYVVPLPPTKSRYPFRLHISPCKARHS